MTYFQRDYNSLKRIYVYIIWDIKNYTSIYIHYQNCFADF